MKKEGVPVLERVAAIFATMIDQVDRHVERLVQLGDQSKYGLSLIFDTLYGVCSRIFHHFISSTISCSNLSSSSMLAASLRPSSGVG